MSSDKPLLSESEPFSTPDPQPLHHRRQSSLRISSLRCQHHGRSFSSSDAEETQDCNLYRQKELDKKIELKGGEAVSGNSLEYPAFRPGRKGFLSGDLGRQCPQRERRRFVSWGGVMDVQQNVKAFEVSGTSSRITPRLQDVNRPLTPQRSERFLHLSMHLEDNMAHHDNPRFIHINDPKKTNDNSDFSGNEIRTSKYTLLNFLPKNLFIQFHRVAYLYFLAIAALNQLPPLAVFGRTVSLFPLLFVLTVTAVKDGYEDWRRHRSDRNENNREALVLQSDGFCPKRWKMIQAGEVVKISSDETIPCDMVLLGTSDPSGIAYIQTMNLDGESNLKTRYARQETNKLVLEGTIISGMITCEQPNRNIYEFMANMELNEQCLPLSQSNIILRGCQLKNTEWAIGVVVYAGQDTKAMQNSAMSPSKRSRLETYMNRETFWLSVFLLIMCLVVGSGMGLWLKRHESQLDTLPYYRKIYFQKGKDGKKYKYYGIPMETFFSFLSSIIVFQIMIPISLYITMELVRLGQSYFMIGDRHMYDSSSNSRFQCRSLNINEDLGQIRYILSDKTGTLTENKMEFKKASIWGKSYGDTNSAADSQGTDVGVEDAMVGGRKWKLKSEITPDSELIKLLYKDLHGEERIAAHEFFLTLAACNTVIPILTDSPLSNGPTSIDYQGESPDEQALVAAASAYGYTLFERTSGHIVIDANGEKLRLDVLGLHEFDSVRKRMSVVIRFPNGSVKVLVKGADTSMFNILRKDLSCDDHIRHATHSHLNDYSSEGLRTLVVAARDLNGELLAEWQHMYEDACTSLTDRVVKLRQTAALIECNLTLLGATAIEDRLQEGVPEAIESLRQAGIKVWVLTGDKQETAMSIGLSCRLLTADMHQIIINGNSEHECRKLLCDAKAKYHVNSANCFNDMTNLKRKSELNLIELSSQTKSPNMPQQIADEEDRPSFGPFGPLALIIDGNSLVYILEKDLEYELFNLATSCKVVLCCRVAPLQKAGIVDMIKSRTDDLTLAIGDGANDVSMIQMADVGVGICGQEGRQAVMASDFAMGQFRFLKRLLLVHGHWNYQRLGYLILYNFYRNAVFVLMLFWYILCTAFSTTSALTDWSSVFYSVIYTSVPTVVVGILDKDLSHKTLLKYPKLYAAGHRQESYNMPLFWITMVDTLWQSLVLFYVPLFTYRESTIDIWSMGSLWTIAVVILVNVHLAMDIQRWLFVTHAAIWGSIIVTYCCMVVLDSIPVFPNYGTIYHLVKSPAYWLSILLITAIGLLPRFIFKVCHQIFWPSDIQIAREAEILRKGRNFSGSNADQPKPGTQELFPDLLEFPKQEEERRGVFIILVPHIARGSELP
ncbi:aminophospholipid ATPase 1 [Perilla frutescens var. hirtella]|uniref:Phospholipid-transporting ATPase n=1 Tax=Perilla frutescens var. hirtella TaxID=608512 RepID=A0AAD4PA58_PERFH|nr:aminophospholipid ATPase 1 [Perilla frutescens var. hirtella]